MAQWSEALRMVIPVSDADCFAAAGDLFGSCDSMEKVSGVAGWGWMSGGSGCWYGLEGGPVLNAQTQLYFERPDSALL